MRELPKDWPEGWSLPEWDVTYQCWSVIFTAGVRSAAARVSILSSGDLCFRDYGETFVCPEIVFRGLLSVAEQYPHGPALSAARTEETR